MAHPCPTCGQACYCDGEDTWMENAETLDACTHDCAASDPECEDEP